MKRILLILLAVTLASLTSMGFVLAKPATTDFSLDLTDAEVFSIYPEWLSGEFWSATVHFEATLKEKDEGIWQLASPARITVTLLDDEGYPFEEWEMIFQTEAPVAYLPNAKALMTWGNAHIAGTGTKGVLTLAWGHENAPNKSQLTFFGYSHSQKVWIWIEHYPD